jgi:hypothetical protein
MATLEDFLRTGRLGPANLGMNPTQVMTALGDPDEFSEHKSPYILKYGPVQLVFLANQKLRTRELRDIAIIYKPKFKKLPKKLRLDDWNPSSVPTEGFFTDYLENINLHPVHIVSGESGTQLVFVSGVVVLFAEKKMHSIRMTQRDSQEPERVTVSDRREPSAQQIRDMFAEADRALRADAPRGALMTAWAGLEAALRRAVLRAGGGGRVGIQPNILLRELFAAQELSQDEMLILEKLRQARTAAVHGLVPEQIKPEMIEDIKTIGQRLLGPSLRKKKEVGYIYPVDAIEAYSILANDKHTRLLVPYLQSKGVRLQVEENAISGDGVQHDIQIDKHSIDFDKLTGLLEEWKQQYMHS